MSKQKIFTMKLAPPPHKECVAKARLLDCPAAQAEREVRADFDRKQGQAVQYQQFLAQKIALSREAIRAGEWYSDAEVEGRFAQRRARAVERNDE